MDLDLILFWGWLRVQSTQNTKIKKRKKYKSVLSSFKFSPALKFKSLAHLISLKFHIKKTLNTL